MVRALTEEAVLYMFKEDKTILITGSKGSGKTNFAGWIMYILIELSYKLWTNIPFFKEENIKTAIQLKKLPYKKGHYYVPKHPNINVVKKLSSALIGMINSGSFFKILILDEIGIHAPSDRAMADRVKAIKDLNKIIRHFETCFVIMSQLETDVPNSLRKGGDVDYHFELEEVGKRFRVTIYKKQTKIDEDGQKYYDYPRVARFWIPLSKYPVDGKHFPGFKVDLNIKEMVDQLSEVEDSIEVMHKGKGEEIIRKMIESELEQIGYLTTGRYAKKYGVSSQTVRRWCEDDKVEYYKTTNGQLRVLDEPPSQDKETKPEPDEG